jgi:hypothetical protein
VLGRDRPWFPDSGSPRGLTDREVSDTGDRRVEVKYFVESHELKLRGVVVAVAAVKLPEIAAILFQVAPHNEDGHLVASDVRRCQDSRRWELLEGPSHGIETSRYVRNMPSAKKPTTRLERHRAEMRRRGFKLVQLWVPDPDAPGYRSAVRRTRAFLAAHPDAEWDAFARDVLDRAPRWHA